MKIIVKLLFLALFFTTALVTIHAQDGMEGVYWARCEDGTWLSISFWASLEASDRAGREANAVPLLPHQRSELIPSPASVDTFDVVERG